jgi:hypothetical protein
MSETVSLMLFADYRPLVIEGESGAFELRHK